MLKIIGFLPYIERHKTQNRIIRAFLVGNDGNNGNDVDDDGNDNNSDNSNSTANSTTTSTSNI